MKSHIRAVLPRILVIVGLLGLALVSFLCIAMRPDGMLAWLLKLTHKPISMPKIFGVYHVCMLAVCLALMALTVLLRKKIRVEKLDTLVFFVGVLFFLMELYKQLYHYAVLGNGTYNFGILPLQFCSYCLYLFLLIPLLPEGKVKDTLYLFCAFYQTMGGALVMAYPLFYRQLSLSIHTMIWHTVMICTGLIIMISRGYGKRYLREVLPPIGVFGAVFALSIVLNLTLTPYAQLSPQPLNLFYMSPYEKCTYFIIKDVRAAFGWVPSLFCYAALFIFIGANTCWLAARLIRLLDRKSAQDQ